MVDQAKLAELQTRNGALREAVDRYLLRAGPAVSQEIDRIASELEVTGDTFEDLERTYRNLGRRADALIAHQLAEPEAFDEPLPPV